MAGTEAGAPRRLKYIWHRAADRRSRRLAAEPGSHSAQTDCPLQTGFGADWPACTKTASPAAPSASARSATVNRRHCFDLVAVGARLSSAGSVRWPEAVEGSRLRRDTPRPARPGLEPRPEGTRPVLQAVVLTGMSGARPAAQPVGPAFQPGTVRVQDHCHPSAVADTPHIRPNRQLPEGLRALTDGHAEWQERDTEEAGLARPALEPRTTR